MPDQELLPSGATPSVPVVTGPGGATPGQNRDNSTPQSNHAVGAAGVIAIGLLLIGMSAAGRNPDGPRPRSDVADERQARLDRTWEEVRRIVAEFHAMLPRDRAEAIGAAYARYSSRFQDSVADQVRAVFADAVRKGGFVPLDHVFLDLAVRGVKNDRPGLNALRACLDRKAARVVFFFATNRLFRKTYRSLQFVEEQVVDKGVRAVFVKSGVDTADAKRWRGLLNMHAMMDEFVVGSTADHVRAAHEGLLDKRLVFGTVSFGYAGRPLDGQTTRRGKPRMTLVVDEVAGGWVRRVTGLEIPGDDVGGPEVVIDYRQDPEGIPAAVAAEAVALYDAGLLEKEVARRLGLARSTVTRVLDARDASRGRAREDGRPRRATLEDKHGTPPTYREIADRVKALADRRLLFGEIAAEMDLDRNTITAAWRWWHASRGLPVPDGRGRRKTLDRKSGVAPPG